MATHGVVRTIKIPRPAASPSPHCLSYIGESREIKNANNFRVVERRKVSFLSSSRHNRKEILEQRKSIQKILPDLINCFYHSVKVASFCVFSVSSIYIFLHDEADDDFVVHFRHHRRQQSSNKKKLSKSFSS